MICPNCKKEFEDMFNFCPSCGARNTNNLKCKTCGATYNEEDVFCHNCGQRLLNKASAQYVHDKKTDKAVDIQDVTTDYTSQYFNALRDGFLKSLEFKGQTNRFDFLSFYITALVIVLLTGTVTKNLYGEGLGFSAVLVFLLPCTAVAVRRMNDAKLWSFIAWAPSLSWVSFGLLWWYISANSYSYRSLGNTYELYNFLKYATPISTVLLLLAGCTNARKAEESKEFDLVEYLAAIWRAFRDIPNLKSKTKRFDFYSFTLTAIAALVWLNLVQPKIGDILSLPIVVAMFSITVRRFRDAGVNVLLGYVPLCAYLMTLLLRFSSAPDSAYNLVIVFFIATVVNLIIGIRESENGR